ncbi:MAG TPA: His/Gly/Thr/Pro-type tRNA ligase C-terminal domain-containing protein, partial [Chloroflexota bacterium]|nr:His/Gly/Thr/Pro-type tRNA ligase C-terminal domain-containing protein [Chloroflexota bacterium]
VPIARKPEEREAIMQAVGEIEQDLMGLARVKVDAREELTPGFKYNEWELRSVPVRLEIGPRDLAAQQVVLARRDTRAKETVPIASLRDRVPALLAEIQQNLYDQALALRRQLTLRVDDYDTFVREMDARNVFIEARHCGDAACEEIIKEDTKATIRCIPFAAPPEDGPCVRCDKPGIGKRVVFSKAY